MRQKTLQIVNISTFLVVILVNYLANALPLNGVMSKDISDKYANQFAPAGITFSIWGIIYSLLIGVMVWQFIGEKNKQLQAIGVWLAANFLLNATWLFTWHYDILWLSLIFMAAILFSLIQLNTALTYKMPPSFQGKTMVQAAFGVYLGWICIATIANVTTYLVSIGWNRFGLSETFWAGSLIGVGSVIGALLVVHFRNRFIGFAIIWALAGIALRQWQLHVHFTAISWAAMTWALGVIAVVAFPRRLM